MLTYLVIAVGSITITQTEKPKADRVGKRSEASHRVVYVGRADYEPEGDRQALVLPIGAAGDVYGEGPFDVTEEILKTWITKYCADFKRVVIVIGVVEPDKTSLRTISKFVDRVKKHVPKETVVTFYIRDHD